MIVQSFNNFNNNPSFLANRYTTEQVKAIEFKVIKMCSEGQKPAIIAKELGVADSLVRCIIKKLSLKNPIELIKEKLFNIKPEELTQETIKNILNCSKNRASGIYASIKEPLRLTKKKELCKQILKMKSEGLTLKEIAKSINKSEHTTRGYLRYIKETGMDISV